VQRLKGRPFALVGVSTNAHPPGKLKEVMEKEQLPWRSFDERSGIIARWSQPSTPGYYLLDGKGVIRRKWAGYPGERAIDGAVEKLLREAERRRSNSGGR
jgi:hypothetical protein